MDILKEIAKDRLVVMVTHNPDLAERYSTRIIRMLDGEITDDSAPLTQEEENREHLKEKSKTENKKLPSMSFATSFGLSLKNLFTKKGRTALTSFAGSIGIIGIALIFAVSQGMTAYIDTVQENTLSSYPLTLEAQSIDMTSLMETFIGAAQSAGEHEKDAVYAKGMIYDMVNSLSGMEKNENDLASFKKYIEAELEKQDGDNALKEAVNGIQYTYDLDLLVYTKNVDGEIIRSDMEELMQDFLVEYLGTDISSLMTLRDQYGISDSPMQSMMPSGMSSQLWQEMLPGENGKLVSPLLEKQYDVVYGSWPTEYNEIVLVLDDNNELNDMSLYALGLSPKEDVDAIMEAAINQTEIPVNKKQWSYEDICNMEYRIILNSDCYTLDSATGTYKDLRTTEAGLQYLYDNAIPLKVSGIIRPNEDAVSTMLSGSIGYTSKLTEYVIEHSKDSDAIKAQQASPTTDIFTGLPFNENTGSLSDAEKETAFREYIKEMDESEKVAAYIQIMSIPSEEQLDASVSQTMVSMTRADMESSMVQGLAEQMGMDEANVKDYVSSMSDEELTGMFTQMVTEQVKMQYAAQVQEQMSGMEAPQLSAALDQAMPGYTTEQCALFYDEITEFSESTYEDNLSELGCVDLESPASINIFASTFENKDVIEDAISSYNENVDELLQIHYTDYVGIMMSSVTTIINAITYVLIAFVAISLIVSSIMIGVITLISVQERTKEIGILRAIGASKRNVSSMFNAETVIIGFTSGALGVLITYLLCIPINLILHHLTGIGNLSAFLPLPVALILIAISMALTLIAGVIPSRSAAKKDPVVALRTE